MMFDISKLNSPSSQALNSLKGQPTKELTGTLAKLSSELKLIENLELLKVNGAKDVIFQQKPAQLIDVSSKSNQNFNLINTQNKVDIQKGDTLQLEVQKNGNRAIISLINKNNQASVTQSPLKNSPEQSTQRGEKQNASKILGQNNNQTQNLTYQNNSIQNNRLASPSPNIVPNTRPTNLTLGSTNTAIQQNSNNSIAADSNNRPAIVQSTISESKLSVNIISKTIPLTVLSITQIAGNVALKGRISNEVANKILPSNSPTNTTQTPSTVQPNVNTQKTSIQSNIHNPEQPRIIQNQQAANQATKALPQASSFLLEVSDGEETFTIKTQHRPEIGSKMTVMVDAKGQIQLLPKETQTSIDTPVENGLKISLPKQLNLQEITQLIKQLDTLSLSNQLGNEKLQQTLTKLMSSIPNLSTLITSPETLKQTLQQSGLFLENNLAKDAPVPEKDIKLNFLKLQAAISEASSAKLPPQFELVEKAIERITTNQLKHLVEAVRTESQLFPVHMELPIKHGNSSSYVQFEIDKETTEKDNQNQEKRRWLVKLKFDFPETGKIEARLSIQDKKAGIIFVAEHIDTELKIRSQLNQVRDNLKNKDIEVERIDCFCAPLESETKQVIAKRLIDVRT